jgi:hypothetical protein
MFDFRISNTKLPVLHLTQVVRLTKFDYRVANRLQTDLQKLRCRVNYHALRFTAPIQKMGEKLIQIMRGRGKYFIALHLRYTHFILLFFVRIFQYRNVRFSNKIDERK